MDVKKMESIIEAILFTMGNSVEVSRIANVIEQDTKTTKKIIRNMMLRYEEEDRGIRILELEDSYQMCTKKEMYEYLIQIAKQPKRYHLTDVVLETLSIVAYKQPVTRLEIERIRGVKSDHAVNKLIEYDLIEEVGRMDAPGRPILFGTTEEFLRRFSVQSVDELPIITPEKIEDFKAFLEAGAAACGGYGTVVPGWDQWYFETLYLNEGVDIITADNTCDLNNEAAVTVTNMIKDWCDSGLAYFAVGTDASATMRQNFQDGKAFSVMHTSSLYNNYVDKCDFEVGMAWYPAGSTGEKYSEVGGQVIGIPANNDQATKNAAWQFLQYCIGKENNMKWAEGTGYMPTRKSVLETDEGIAFLEAKPAFQCIFDNLDLINPRIQHGSWSELATTWKTYMDIMLNQNGDIASNSDDMVVEIDEILAD